MPGSSGCGRPRAGLHDRVGTDGWGSGLLRLLHQQRPGMGEVDRLAARGRGLPSRRPGVGLHPGHDWAHEMHQATSKAERVVAVLSATYLRSGHGEAEWRAFYAKDPSGERGLLLPVRISEVDPPGLLTTRIFVDFVGRDASSARAALLAAARGPVESRPRRRSSQAPDHHRQAPSKRRGFPGSCRHSGTCRFIPTRSSPAATCC